MLLSDRVVRWFNSPWKLAMLGGAAVLLVAAILGGYLAVQSGTPYDFSLNQKVSASSLLRLSFPADMDHASVEENLVLPKGLAATQEWEGTVLVLRPAQKLTAGMSYVVRVDGNAKKSDGTALGKDLVFTFTVSGLPVLAAQIPPAESKHVPLDAEITLVFDRPVVPLTQVQGTPAEKRFEDWPVEIKPALRGRWRWLGTTTASFVPEKGLSLATRYTVSVPSGIKTVSGDATDKDFTWSFETERPLAIGSTPESGRTDAGPGTSVSIIFNQDMDLISARDSIILSEKSPNGTLMKLPISLVKYGTRTVNDKKVTDKKIVVVVPEKSLQFKKQYVVEARAGIRGLVGDLGSAENYTFNFGTVGAFEVISGVYSNGMLELVFSNPVEGDAVKAAMSISPAVDMKEVEFSSYGIWFNDRNMQKVSAYPPLKPSTKYTVSVKALLKDDYGQKLERPFDFTFTTPDLEPGVFLHPRGKNFGIFEKGKPPVYFMNAVNVSELNIEFGELPFEAFTSMLSDDYYDGSRDFLPQSVVKNYKTLTLKPPLKKNEWDSIPFDVEKDLGTLKPGLYFLRVKAPEWVDKYNNNKPREEDRIFAVTNIALTLKYSYGKALVWAADLQTGDPVAGATIQFRKLKGGVAVSGKTDKNGFFETEFSLKDFMNTEYDSNPEFYVTAQTADDFAFVGSSWNNGFQPYDFNGVYTDFHGADRPAYIAQSYLYTERPLYGAGDTVEFKGIVRFLNHDGVYSVPGATRSAHVTIRDPNGTEVFAKDIKLSEFGSFNGSFVTAKEAPLGYYGIQADIVPDNDHFGSGYGSFSVLAYRKPEYRLEVLPEKEEYANRDTAKVSISGNYYFGAPMSGAKVHWRLQKGDYYFNKVRDGWYSFALEGSWCWYECVPDSAIVTEGDGVLDAAGRMTVTLPLNIDEDSVGQVMTLEADITDENNQIVSQRGSFIVHKSNLYVGLRSDNYGVAAGEKAGINVITVDSQGVKLPGTTVDLKLYSRKWNVTKEKGVDGEYYYTNEPEDTFIRQQSIVTNDEGKATASMTLDDSGEYRIVAVAKDGSGRESKAGWSMYVWGDTYFNWPRSNNDRIDVVADKPEYKPGDVAKLIVKSPYQGKGVKALVTVERENVLTKKVIDVTSSAMPIEIPIDESLVPTAYVSVVLLKPRIGETFNENGLDTGAPAFKVGYVRLDIDTSSKRLNVTIRTDKEKYLPRETVKVDITAVDAKGNPVQGDFSLGVVDMSLLDLAGFQMPDLVQYFYSQRGLGVTTANMLTYLMERFKPGSKGGGGGGDEDRLRGEFKDTAYWNPRIVTDASGRATATFTLPDNLTTWHLLALGATKDTLVGGFAKTIIETKRVIVRPVRPRFAVASDQIVLGAIVHNYLDQDGSFTVKLSGKGFAATGKAEQTVSVPKDGQVKVEFPVSVQDVSSMTMRFTATAASAKDDIEETIPVFRFGVQQTNATANVTENQETEKVSVPTKADAPDGELSVTLSPSLGIYLPESLEYLSTFPYGCAEQIVSGFVPNIAIAQLKGFDQFKNIEAPDLEKKITAGLQSLYRFQRPDGGFGYWDSSLRSYPYLTIYILDALRMTQDAGYAIDGLRAARAMTYLKNIIRSSDPRDYMDDETRSYGVYVLAMYGSPDAAAMNSLHKKRADLALFSRAYLAMAYKKAGGRQNEAKANEILEEILGHVSISPRGAHFEEGSHDYWYAMNTNDRTTALVLKAIVGIQPDHPLLPRIIRGLLDHRVDGHWDTTQSTAQVILAFVEYLNESQELEYDEQAAVEIDGKKVLDAAFKAPALEKKDVMKALTELPRGKDIDVKIGKTGPGKLYYDVVLSYFYTPDRIEPAEEGIGIVREMTPLTKADASMKVGTTHKTTLTITVPETRNFVAVESMLPAGMEPIDLQFATSQQNLLEDAANSSTSNNWRDWYRNQTWRFTHIEFRDDRVFLFAEELPPGVYRYEYLTRATTPGKFRERPAKVWEMYYPEVFGQTEGKWLEIGR